ncbi:hypothetical protein ACRALDRAFT_1062683 [Sodiomyces alcalophilus JCM 7366]|uniref:uncharacterized protein n=1 Tax=Sodiomyces alcalophilus JCM 7366 TaxID=591952 RepID=UPI0039B633C9
MCSKIIPKFKCSHQSSAYPPYEIPCAYFRSASARAKQSNEAVQACPYYNESVEQRDSFCPECQQAGRGS